VYTNPYASNDGDWNATQRVPYEPEGHHGPADVREIGRGDK